MTLVRVRQEKFEAVFELDVVLYGDKYDAFKDAMDGARVGAKTSYAPITKALPICKRLKAASFSLDLSPEIVRSFEALLLHEAKDQEHAGVRLEEVKRGLAELGMELYPFQEVGIYFLASRRAAMLSDEMGCIFGHAVVNVNRAGKGFAITLEKLFHKFHGGPSGHNRKWDPSFPTFIRSLCDGELRLNRIADVLDKGTKSVVLLRLRSGKKLRLTPDHEVRTKTGFIAAEALRPGDVVLTNGVPRCKRCKSTKKVSIYPRARYRGYCRRCIYRKLRSNPRFKGRTNDKDGYVRLTGPEYNDHPHALRRKGHRYVLEHVLVMEKKLGRRLRPSERVHHKNEVKSDNRPSNLELMDSLSEHAVLHGKAGGYRNLHGSKGGKGGDVLFFPKEDIVVSVEPDGEAHVYDVVCADPHRNFVANGIVVHNCGKTVQALTALPYQAPVLVVCPAVAKGVWKREAAKWRQDFKVSILSGSSSFRWPGPGEIIVTNYDVLPLVPPQGATQGLSVVFDEAHYLKSFKSQRRKASAKIAEVAAQAQGRVWLLTGTPLQNEPPELYSVLEVAGLAVEAFGRYADFVELFHGKEISFDKKVESEEESEGEKEGEAKKKEKRTTRRKMVWGKPDESVPERLARVMLRRLKRDVLPELPEKRVSVLEVEVTEDTLRELDKIAFTLEHEDGVNFHDPYEVYEATRTSRVVFERVATLRKLVASAKVPAALELAEEYEDENEPLIVASAHLEPLRAFEKRKGWAVIEGKTPAHLRTEIEDAFQRGELKGLACSIRAAGVALTLTRACNMVFVDESWNPAENEQMEDRVARIGQTRGVEIIRLFCDHELDKHVLRVLHRKEKLIARVVDAAARRPA